MTAPPANMSLAEARQWLLDHVDDGETCPCCTQFAKVYRRKINSSMAFGIITMYREHRRNWGHAPSTANLSRLGGELARLKIWNLLEESDAEREDGGRAGWWRLTDLGVEFIHNRVRVPKYARIYNGRLLNFDTTKTSSITDALGTRFNYTELMKGI